MERKAPILTIVVPCYNEEEVFGTTEARLRALVNEMKAGGLVSERSRVVYVDDGSRDRTWELISNACEEHPTTDAGVKLSNNVGHQKALLAGLDAVKDYCNIAISIDADLQDDINVIPAMVESYLHGNEIVYGVRSSRDSDTWFKRTTAISFYKFMKTLGVESVYNHADFRLMSARAVKELLRYRENNIFLRGIVPRIGLKNSIVEYERKAREAGESKYPLKKMVNFALEGITSFSIKPIRMVMYMGILFVFFAFLIFIYAICSYITDSVIEGWTSLILSIWFCTGILLISIGIVGEYIGKIYMEVKDRPRYVIEETKGNLE